MQTLALHLVRIFNKAVLLILTKGYDESNCNQGAMAWDSDKQLCYSLAKVEKKDALGADGVYWSIQEVSSFVRPLFEKYGADRLTM